MYFDVSSKIDYSLSKRNVSQEPLQNANLTRKYEVSSPTYRCNNETNNETIFFIFRA